jgi:DUF917 family protein
MRSLHKQELEDIVIGAGLLGAGGGGSTAEGLKLAERVLEFGSEVKLASVEEIPDDQWGAVIAGVGSPKASLNRVRTYSPTWALELLEKTSGFKSSFVIPFEVGAGNSLNPMLAAVQRKIPIVNGDPAGRAVPELQMSTFYLRGIPVGALALADEDRITAVITAEKTYDIERVSRAITAELGGVSAVATHAMQARDMKRSIIPGTTDLAEKIGATIRSAKGKGSKVAEALARDFEGVLLGRGKVASVTGETRGGFDFGMVEVKGDKPIRVLFQNENMIANRGDQLLAVVPDLICSIDEAGNPLTNADIREGMNVMYLGFAAQPAFRGPEVHALFQDILAALDYRGGFRPIEELHAM